MFGQLRKQPRLARNAEIPEVYSLLFKTSRTPKGYDPRYKRTCHTCCLAMTRGLPRERSHKSSAGHVIPGSLFLLWGLYWAQASFRRHIKSQHSGRGYISKPWYPVLAPGSFLFALEPFLKLISAPIGLSIELYFDSKDGFRYAALNKHSL